MKKIFLCLVLMFMVSVCGADTLRITYGSNGLPGYDHIDTFVIVDEYGYTTDTLFEEYDTTTTVIDTYFVITGTGAHIVYLRGIYDGFPGEWYDIKKWKVDLSINAVTSGLTGDKVTIYVVDTSGTDVAVSGVQLTFKDLNNNDLGYVVTKSGGYEYFTYPATDSVFLTGIKPGYVFTGMADGTGDTLIITGVQTDTLYGYNIAIGSPGAANLCRVYDYVYDVGGNVVEGAEVTATLKSGLNVRDSCSNVSISNYRVTARTNSSGYWKLDLIKTLCLESTYGSTEAIKYKVIVKFPSGTEMVNKNVTVPDSTSYRMVW